MSKQKGLGRGLSELLRDSPSVETNETKLVFLSPDLLSGNARQPRTLFDEEKIQELSESIKKNGVLQPILVRKISEIPDKYEIIAGERRWRAAKLAGIQEIPVIVKDFTNHTVLEIALIENIQREDLSPIEEATAYQRLMEDYDYTQESLAATLGKSRPYITNMLRLLSLPAEVKDLLQQKKISVGHARSLIGSENPEKWAQRIIADSLSVRAVEELVAQEKKDAGIAQKNPVSISRKRASTLVSPVIDSRKDEDVIALEQTISLSLGMPVQISDQNEDSGGGIVSIYFANLSDLDKLLQKLTR